MLEKVKTYWEKEYNELVKYLEEERTFFVPRNTIIDNAMQRCLGVAMFAQTLDVSYEEIDKEYQVYWQKFWDLK